MGINNNKDFLPGAIIDLIKSFLIEHEHTCVYTNPHLLQDITQAIYDYTEYEDEDLNDLIVDEFGR